MKKIQYILAGTMLVSLSLGAQAQTQPQDTTMNRTVVVEQEYNPDNHGCLQSERASQGGTSYRQQKRRWNMTPP